IGGRKGLSPLSPEGREVEFSARLYYTASRHQRQRRPGTLKLFHPHGIGNDVEAAGVGIISLIVEGAQTGVNLGTHRSGPNRKIRNESSHCRFDLGFGIWHSGVAV